MPVEIFGFIPIYFGQIKVEHYSFTSEKYFQAYKYEYENILSFALYNSSNLSSKSSQYLWVKYPPKETPAIAPTTKNHASTTFNAVPPIPTEKDVVIETPSETV